MRGDGASGPRVVIVGAGFAGLTALGTLATRHGWKRAAQAGRARPRLKLVDRNTYSTFQPLLYQVATAGLTSSDVAYPAWTAVHKAGAHFRLGEVTGLDTDARQVLLADGSVHAYDYLILASGVSAAFFGVPGAAEHALSLYTRRDAITLRNALMDALESRNEGLTDPDVDITVVGGGATGVELAGALAELRNFALAAVYPNIDRSMFHVRLIEMGTALLAPYNRKLRDYTRQQLVNRGVEVMLGTAIKEVRADSVLLADGSERRSDITVWAAGV